MENCIFCKIVAGEIPASKIYEDSEVIAFLDISQATKGHTLVVPKKHVRNVLEMSEEMASQLFSPIPKIARALKKVTSASGLNIINNNETIAGQTVFHAHIHLLPRYNKEDGLAIHFTEHDPNFEELGLLAGNIQKEIQA
ncbi:HIT family protein [Streptococcus macacae]|uniref:Protein hit n=1 Tax=Streptococcus macacae NCTC 11558 TaxID=764298 RepID=G5JXY6_9STRE|nr:HIT family protein [Streptococcus macacae]EHJ51941.1 protein hit [Streptococcus macacae NCTC 11558]SUN77904.1 protein hit [Streptococcus macacae NCTC 11558]